MLNKFKVVVLDDYENAFSDAGLWQPLYAHIDLTVHHHKLTGTALMDAIVHANVLVLMRDRTPVNADIVAKLPNLHYVVFTGTRNAALDMDALAQRNIPVGHTEWGPSKDSTAELTWALLMAAHKRVIEQHALLNGGGWRNEQSLLPVLHGETIGIVGLGEIGGRVARYAQAFGMRVIAWSPRMTQERAQAAGVEFVSLDALLAQSRVVSLHLVPTADSKGLMHRGRFQQMRPDSMLINTSRSSLVVTADLCEALHTGTIAQAALDVFDQEPLPADSPLRRCPNVLMTPHLGFIAQPVISAFKTGVVNAIKQWMASQP